MISEAFVTKVLTEPVELGLRGGDSSIAVYPRKKAARVADPLHALYREYSRKRKIADAHGGSAPSWAETLRDAGIRTSCDVIPWIEAHPVPEERKPKHPFSVYPIVKASEEGDPFNTLYLEYNRRRKVDARKGCHRITWMEALAEIGIKSKEDAQRYVEAWKAAHEEA